MSRRASAFLLCWLVAVPAAEAAVQAGAASEPFVLPAGVPLAGYSRRHGKPSHGTHDPVGARALALSDDDTSAMLVSADVLIVDEPLFNAVRRRLGEAGLPGDLVLVLAATHTHSGPGGYGRQFLEKISMGHYDPSVFDALVEAIVRCGARAWKARVPVRAASGAAGAEGLVHNRVKEDGPVDASVTVTGFYPVDAQAPLALVVSFAAHPTTLGASNMELSGDYPGALMRELERRFPSATALFFAGAAGDQGPHKDGEGFERPERLGAALAERAASVVEGLRPEPFDHVRAAQAILTLPPARVRAGSVTVPRWMGRRLVDDDATLALVIAGPTAFMGAPCDLATASLGARLKAAARERGLMPHIIGFASDYIGYCIPEAFYREHAYESSMAFNGPRAGELVTEKLIEMLDDQVRGER